MSCCQLLTSGLLFLHVKRGLYVKGLRSDDALKKVGNQGIHVHMALEQPYTSSVASVLISVTTDMSPTGDLLVTSIFAGEVSSHCRQFP